MKPTAQRPADNKMERRAEQHQRLGALIEELLRIRASAPPMSDEEMRRHRIEGRP